MFRSGIFLLLLVGALSSVQGKGTYAAYVPEIIRVGFNYSITTLILNNSNPVDVTAMLSSSRNRIKLQTQSTIDPGRSKRLTLGQLPLGYKGSRIFTMTITGTDSKTNKRIFHSSRGYYFKIATKSISILIQTDKAIYQPGQTIKFRAVCLNPELRPVDGLVKYSVKDPNGNIVLLNTDVPLSHGVASGKLPLNKDAIAGVWKIEYTAKGYTKGLDIEVKLYKLPKFKVIVEAPTYIYPGSSGMTVRLKATYTYGKPVKGRASLKISIHNLCCYPPSKLPPGMTPPPPLATISYDFKTFNEVEEIFVPMNDVKKLLGWDGKSEKVISITGNVTEKLTGTTFNETTDVDVKQTNIKLEALFTPDTIKPGLSYTAYIKVTEQDGKFLTEVDRLKNQLIVHMSYWYRSPEQENATSTYRRKSIRKAFDIAPGGIVKFTVAIPEGVSYDVSFSAFPTILSQDRNLGLGWTATRAKSPSRSYMHITTSETNVHPEQNASVIIETTDAVSSFNVMLISRGYIVSDHKLIVSNLSSRTHIFQFVVTYKMMPGVQVLASYVTDDGEVVADFIKLTVSAKLRNELSVHASSTRVDAGTDVTVAVQTSSAGAYVGVRAVDQSVLLLKSGNDISIERVLNDINEYSKSDDFYSDSVFRTFAWYTLPTKTEYTADVFEDAGIIMITDAFLNARPLDEYVQARSFASNVDSPLASPSSSRGKPSDTSASGSSKRTRTLFPETWLWDSKITGSNGSATFQTTAPDTITSWVWSVFSVSDQHGLGITDTFKITVFRQFFVSLNLPLKVTRGEIIIVQAVVFNYLESDVTAQLILGTSSKFELIIPGDDRVAAGAHRRIYIPANGDTSVKFPIRANTLGEVPVTVTAISSLASDSLTRVLFVKPEGIPQCYSSSILINHKSKMEEDTTHQLQISIPEGIVDGSEKVKLSVYGNILGNILSNLGRLLKVPYGCGEQNMLNFAPDVFVTLYLHKAGILDAETRKKAFEHFYNGYMKELRYKHPDGSYSAFGPSDNSGSTWLTAFVAKCFIFARELRPELVEEKIIDEALHFLVKQQNKDGSFREPGKVSHKAMQGKVNSHVTMTAYVLVTLRETNYAFKNKKVLAASVKARTYLENNLDSVLNDKYDLAIVTYALHVAESSKASEALEVLEKLATNQGGMRYFEESTDGDSTLKPNWQHPYHASSTNDIEMTSYVLLTYVRRDQVALAVPVIKWITSKQNELGGYSSTQDTVIATQAMSNVAGMITNRNQNLNITAIHSADVQFSQQLQITVDNSMIFNQFNVPSMNGNVSIAAIGVGVGVAQLSVCYNVPNDPFEEGTFACTVKVLESSYSSARFDFCCSLKPGDNATGMFLFEIGLPNGFTADVPAEIARNQRAQLVELDDESLNIYYDNLEPGSPRCAKVNLQRFADICDSKPQPISATDYYNQNRKVTYLLEIENLRSANVCQVCGKDCVGCPAPRLGHWTQWTPCVEFCAPEISTREKKCIDFFTNTIVEPEECGLTKRPSEMKPCPPTGFPCPDLTEGLWFDIPYQIWMGLNVGLPQYRCQISPYITDRFHELPGVSLNLYHSSFPIALRSKQFVRCESPPLINQLVPESGITISLLIRRASVSHSKQQVFLAFGDIFKKPLYIFEQLWWDESFRFVLTHDGVGYQVHNITKQQLPVDQWRHVVITWRALDGAKVYINGRSVGTADRFKNAMSIPRRPVFFIGKSTYDAGYITAEFSALNFWNTTLIEEEVASLYRFYQPVLSNVSVNFDISVRHMRHFAPDIVKDWFKKSYNMRNHSVPLLPPFPFPLPYQSFNPNPFPLPYQSFNPNPFPFPGK